MESDPYRNTSMISWCPRRFAHAEGSAHGSSSGRLGFAPFFNNHSTISFLPSRAAQPSGLEEYSVSMALTSVPKSHLYLDNIVIARAPIGPAKIEQSQRSWTQISSTMNLPQKYSQ